MTTLSSHSLLLRRALPFSENSCTLEQLRMDQMIGSFSRGASDSATLVSFLAGGVAGRLLKIGGISWNSSPFFRYATQGISLLGEASVFEGSHRLFQVARGKASRDVLRWEGEQGLASGILNSSLTFLSLRTAGLFVQSQNILLQHALQSSAFVFAHQLAARVGLQALLQESLMEQFVHAEITNIQLQGTTSLLQTAFPTLAIWERSVDLTHSQFPRHFFPQMLRVTSSGHRLCDFAEEATPSVSKKLASPMVGLDEPQSIEPRRPEVLIDFEIYARNIGQVLSLAQAAEGRDFRIAPTSLHPSEGYHPLIKLWFDLLPQGGSFLSLRMEIGGLVFRYAELPPSQGSDAKHDTLQMGTVIELLNPELHFNESLAVLSSFRSYVVSHWGEEWLEGRSSSFRTDFPENIANQVRLNAYQRYAQMRQWIHSISDEVIAMNEQVKRASPLTPPQKSLVNDILQRQKDWMSGFSNYQALWRWMEMHRMKAPSEVHEGPTIRSVLHDINNRLTILMTLNYEMGVIASNEPVDEGLIHALQMDTHLSIAKAVGEGMGMAQGMADEIDLEIKLPSALPSRFQNLFLREDIELEFALSDVMGNLLSNALVRYCNLALPPQARKATVEAHFLRGGDLQVTVSDNGIGILAHNFDRLGEEGFREARQEVQGSKGHGIRSVIQILRERGWGPLWIKTVPEKGSSFRFVIPKSDFERAEDFPSDPLDEDVFSFSNPRSDVERNLEEGFRVPPASMDMAIRQVFAQIPSEESLAHTFSHRRLEALHRLLAGIENPHSLRVPESGAHSDRIPASGARVVYWANPEDGSFILPQGFSLENYLGRGVEVGGYLVIQNRRGPFEAITRELNFDRSRWQLIFQQAPGPSFLGIDDVLPTGSRGELKVIFVYRRIR